MLKLTIRSKFILLMLGVSLIPLAAINLYWYNSSQSSLRAAAKSQQELLTGDEVTRVNQYLNDKVSALIIHSQSPSVQAQQMAGATQDLHTLIEQDGDIQQLSLANATGKVVIALNRHGSLPTGQSIATTDVFRATTFLSGKEYISPVTYTAAQHPIVSIAVPLVQYASGQNLASLSTADNGQIRTAAQIKGVLIEQVDLSGLWQTVLAQGNNSGGYAFVVDSTGNLIAHPNGTYLANHNNIATTPVVAAFLRNPSASAHPITTTSETGVPVLSSYGQISRTDWGVITEEPLQTIFATATHVAQVGLTSFAVIAVIVVIMSLVFSRRLTTPIRKLADGAQQLSGGNLDVRVVNNSSDEIGILARTFNTMAANLSLTLRRASAEASKVNVMLNNVAEGILAVGDDGTIIVSNVAASVLIGDLPQGVINKSMHDLYNWSLDGKPFVPSLNDLGVFPNVRLLNKNKRVLYVDVLVNPIEGDATGIRAIITLLDKTKEAELENMKVDFVSMAAHELRTPMTTIRGYVDLIRHDESFQLPEATQTYFGRIESSSVELVALINNLLNVSKIERGAFTVQRDKIDWAQAVVQSVSNQQFSARAKTITLKYDGVEHDVFIYADELAMTEVINNLIANAINYTPEGGEVTVSLSQSAEGIKTAVKDNGIGIPASGIPHLFTKFFRSRSELRSGSGGTGLGLYISKSIVELHDGTIHVESVEGSGSTFTVIMKPFDADAYNKLNGENPGSVRQRHGWFIKNTTR